MSDAVTLSIIVAMSDDRVIGLDNKLPWHLPADLQWFRRHTLGKTVVMGRKTFESIGKALPGRTNIVVTHEVGFEAPGCKVVHSIDAALAAAAQEGDEVMVMGGASFYAQLLPRADRMYLTLVHGCFAGDAWFPRYVDAEWRSVERSDHEPDEKNPYPYSFLIMERIRP